MDAEIFANSDFSPKSFINAQLKDKKETDISSHAYHLYLSLQMQSRELSSQLDEYSEAVSQDMPRASRALKALSSRIVCVNSKIGNLQKALSDTSAINAHQLDQ